eukprot:tig00000037_g10103.t1
MPEPIPPHDIRYTPHWSLTGRNFNDGFMAESSSPNGSPGPSYKPDPQPRRKGPAYSFGVKPAAWLEEARSPGSIYDLPPPSAKGASMTTAARGTELNQHAEWIGPLHNAAENYGQEGPGPAAYVPPEAVGKSTPAYSFGIRPAPSPRPHTAPGQGSLPGPGSYDVPGSFGRKGRGGTFGAKNHAQLNQMAGLDSPGPGAYAPVVGREGARSSFAGGSKPARPRSAVAAPGAGPGPGQYVVREAVPGRHGRGTKFGTGANHVVSGVDAESPGPAAYGPGASITQSPARGWKIGTAARPELLVNDAPGPKYAARRGEVGDGAPRYGFGSSDRHHQHAVYIGALAAQDRLGVQSPGPAAYEVAPLRSRGRPSFGRAQRSGSSERSRVPGPGSYDVAQSSFAREGRSFGPSKAHRIPKAKHSDGLFVMHTDASKLGRESPGPIYRVPHAAEARRRGPSFGISYKEPSEQGRYLSGALNLLDNLGKGSPGPLYHPEVPSYKFH